MFVVIRAKHIAVVLSLLIVIALFLLFMPNKKDNSIFWDDSIPVNSELEEEFTPLLEEILSIRDQAMLDNEVETTKELYNVKVRLGLYAFEHEKKKITYLHSWADKQGVNFLDIDTFFKVRGVKEEGGKICINFSAITEYTYEYVNMSDITNKFRIATYHVLDLVEDSEKWLITKEWYTDPFADSLSADNLKVEDNRVFILSQSPRDFSNLNEKRVKAIEYADLYCGASDNEEYYFRYNKDYKNYNSIGGDCTNFASQVLYKGGFKKTGG